MKLLIVGLSHSPFSSYLGPYKYIHTYTFAYYTYLQISENFDTCICRLNHIQRTYGNMELPHVSNFNSTKCRSKGLNIVCNRWRRGRGTHLASYGHPLVATKEPVVGDVLQGWVLLPTGVWRPHIWLASGGISLWDTHMLLPFHNLGWGRF